MSSEKDMLENIKANVAIIIGDLQRNGIENDDGEKALQFLENYIIQRQDELSEKAKDSLHATVGAYFGECLCRAYVFLSRRRIQFVECLTYSDLFRSGNEIGQVGFEPNLHHRFVSGDSR